VKTLFLILFRQAEFNRSLMKNSLKFLMRLIVTLRPFDKLRGNLLSVT